tara:strand:- start:132 stop:629 length:498 start_codon:yes stop_codon:yes gene_type:complete
MNKISYKKFFVNFMIATTIFLIDRISKNYIIDLYNADSAVDIYVNSYLNLYLIWNKGIAFGLLSFNESFSYKIISLIIVLITIIILVMIINHTGFKMYALLAIFGGSIGNLFDRFYYSAVPDFIDLHINNLHWFIFNVADIFITTGVLCLICAEMFSNNHSIKKQ